jgi:adenylate cyclase
MVADSELIDADSSGAWLESSDGRSRALHGKCDLGRGPENDVVIDSPKASRKHAVIHGQDQGQYWLVDLASRNGTYRNDRRLVRPTLLRHGDRLNIGGDNFVFHQPTSPPANGDEATGMFGRSSSGDATVLELRQQNLWLLIADIQDFTALSVRMSVEELAVTMGRWLRECHRIVEKALGRIPKYIGDGFLACWEDRADTATAVVAALRDFQQLRKSSPVCFRVALHYGMITFGEQSAWGEPAMLGPEMNYIFRLEDLASKLGVAFCLSSSAHEKLTGLIPMENVPGEHKLKGFEGLHRCFRVPESA